MAGDTLLTGLQPCGNRHLRDRVPHNNIAKVNKGSAAKCNDEFNWIIESIEYPDGYVPEDEEKIRGLIKEAFIVESYSELFNHERVKNVSVRFEC